MQRLIFRFEKVSEFFISIFRSGKLAISASFGMWYLIIVEVFAIEVSMQLLGFSQILGRADPIAAPFIFKSRDQQTLNNKSWSMTYRRYFIPSKAKTGLVTDDHIWIGFFGFSSLFLFPYWNKKYADLQNRQRSRRLLQIILCKKQKIDFENFDIFVQVYFFSSI